MKLFNRKMNSTTSCCKNVDCHEDSMNKAEEIKATSGIMILGSGCAKCNALEAATRQALDQLQIQESIVHITDFAQIAAFGVMSTPALVIDRKVVSYGKVLKVEEITEILRKTRN